MTAPISAEQLAEIEARLAAAKGFSDNCGHEDSGPCDCPDEYLTDDIAALLQALRAERAEVARLSQQVRGMRSQYTPRMGLACKPQTRDGCGNDSCQHCLQYNWSDPGR